jgi:hypothetical protein
VAASAAVLREVADGSLTPGEAAEISKLIEGVAKTLRKFGRSTFPVLIAGGRALTRTPCGVRVTMDAGNERNP